MEPLEELHHRWGWMLAFGVLAVLWGIFAIAYSVFFTLVSVLAISWLLIIGGVIETVQALRHHGYGHLVLYIIEGVLAIVIGLLMLRSPQAGALIITLLLAAYFIVAGIFRIVAAVSMHLPNWGWTLFSGILTLALGVIVWGGWPITAFWVLGIFVGINLIFMGVARIMLALALHHGHFEALPA